MLYLLIVKIGYIQMYSLFIAKYYQLHFHPWHGTMGIKKNIIYLPMKLIQEALHDVYKL